MSRSYSRIASMIPRSSSTIAHTLTASLADPRRLFFCRQAPLACILKRGTTPLRHMASCGLYSSTALLVRWGYGQLGTDMLSLRRCGCCRSTVICCPVLAMLLYAVTHGGVKVSRNSARQRHYRGTKPCRTIFTALKVGPRTTSTAVRQNLVPTDQLPRANGQRPTATTTNNSHQQQATATAAAANNIHHHPPRGLLSRSSRLRRAHKTSRSRCCYIVQAIGVLSHAACKYEFRQHTGSLTAVVFFLIFKLCTIPGLSISDRLLL